jgi:phytoene dehydrogenase-like protein
MKSLKKKEYDAVVVGSGPNGLAAAILLQQSGLRVIVIEGKKTIGGGLRSEELTLPGFTHDVCSAIHPMAISSPFFSKLPLAKHGLEFIHPTFAAGHPFDDGSAVILDQSLAATVANLGTDGENYKRLIEPVARHWSSLTVDILGPLTFPRDPVRLASFGLKALTSAHFLSRRFQTEKARAFWAGMAAHSILPLEKLTTSAIALALLAAAHSRGWPLPKGGSQQIANALGSYFTSIGGVIETGMYIQSLQQLPSAHAVLFDITPKQLLGIAGHKFSSLYAWQLQRYRYGMGVFKMDWALSGPVPWRSKELTHAGTVHLGNTYDEIAASERMAWKGKHSDRPYILVAQQSLFDIRAPRGKHTLWAYCHVPNGSTINMTAAIESQIERFAPGFKDLILQRHTMNSQQMNERNPNYIGGDINGGVMDLRQLFTRPALRWSPYRTSAKGVYICSSSTPPGGGVHGMCGYHAAMRVLKDIFN